MLVACVAAGGPGCAGGETGPGVLMELVAPAEAARRPDALYYYWLTPRGVSLQGNFPDRGELPATGESLGSLFIELRAPLAEARALVVRGLRDDQVVSGGGWRIDPTGERRIYRRLQLGGPLPDEDRDGTPDLVEHNCLVPGAMSCPTPPAPDGGVPDAGDGGATGDGTPEAGPDAGDAQSGDGDVPPAPDVPPEAAPDTTEAGGDTPREAGSPNPVLSVGLLGHWRFDDGTGSLSARDSSTNGNTAVLVGIAPGTAWVGGAVGGALEIPTGGGALVPNPTSLDTISRAFTIAAWTYRTANRAGLSNVVSRRAAGTPDLEYFGLAFLNDGRIRGFINTQISVNPLVSSANPVPLNQWMHVAFVYTGIQVLIYVNGVPAGMAAYNLPVASMSGQDLCLGCGQNKAGVSDVDQGLGGRLDELVIYSRALPIEEIKLLAAGELPAPP
jgi:hypothetical protein